jgi:hypothetical protein
MPAVTVFLAVVFVGLALTGGTQGDSRARMGLLGADGDGLTSRTAYYRNCDAARSAGAAPLRVGDPGYRSALDADSDGVACEPYYGN